MRHFKEARIRIHGDEAEGAKFVSLARTLLGSLIQRDGNIGGLEQSVHKASVPGADIRVSFNSWVPVIDIWVREEEKREPLFGCLMTLVDRIGNIDGARVVDVQAGNISPLLNRKEVNRKQGTPVKIQQKPWESVTSATDFSVYYWKEKLYHTRGARWASGSLLDDTGIFEWPTLSPYVGARNFYSGYGWGERAIGFASSTYYDLVLVEKVTTINSSTDSSELYCYIYKPDGTAFGQFTLHNPVAGTIGYLPRFAGNVVIHPTGAYFWFHLRSTIDNQYQPVYLYKLRFESNDIEDGIPDSYSVSPIWFHAPLFGAPQQSGDPFIELGMNRGELTNSQYYAYVTKIWQGPWQRRVFWFLSAATGELVKTIDAPSDWYVRPPGMPPTEELPFVDGLSGSGSGILTKDYLYHPVFYTYQEGVGDFVGRGGFTEYCKYVIAKVGDDSFETIAEVRNHDIGTVVGLPPLSTIYQGKQYISGYAFLLRDVYCNVYDEEFA